MSAREPAQIIGACFPQRGAISHLPTNAAQRDAAAEERKLSMMRRLIAQDEHPSGWSPRPPRAPEDDA